MFDLMKFEKPEVRDERLDAESGLSRFKKETGIDFFDLLNDKQLRAKFLVGKENQDTDEDEAETQKLYENFQKKLIKED